MNKGSFKTGIEVFCYKKIYKNYQKAKIALLTHQGAVTSDFKLSYQIFKELFGNRLLYLFSPQHGLFSEKQANMIGSPDEVEPLFGISVKSLYGPRLSPDPDDLKRIDVIFIDLQEVGCRVYTYIWTLYLLLKVANDLKKEVVILDRPNPLGGIVEGPILEREYFSFVGLDSLPMRHGLTIGEIALLFKKRHFSELSLQVIPMENYLRDKLFPYYGRPWILPSPNLPSFDCAFVYPGMVLLEGTNLSEGRGTTLPFLIFGAPYLKFKETYELLLENFPSESWGVRFKPHAFEPTFDKWQGKRCFGFQIFVENYSIFKPVSFALKLLKLIRNSHKEFTFLEGPYEYEEKKKPIEILIGNKRVIDWLFGDEKGPLEHLLMEGLNFYLQEIDSVKLYR